MPTAPSGRGSGPAGPVADEDILTARSLRDRTGTRTGLRVPELLATANQTGDHRLQPLHN